MDNVLPRPILQIRDLMTHFPYVEDAVLGRIEGHVRAVDGVSIDIGHGEIVGLVGESGCGKSTLARTVTALEKMTSGSIMLEGRELKRLTGRQHRKAPPKLQMVFQDPYASLNPRMTVLAALSEPLRHYGLIHKTQIPEAVSALMDEVGLSAKDMKRYPHEFSSGQRQRIAIARALVLEPKLLIADEPVSALDVSVRSQILNLLTGLVRRRDLSMLFISHDLSVVRHIAHRIAVMYLGRIVETGGSDQVFSRPQHPYTQCLLSAIPIPDPDMERSRKRMILPGDSPSALDPPAGCRFHPRCRYARRRCAEAEPKLLVKQTGHLAACFFSDRIAEA